MAVAANGRTSPPNALRERLVAEVERTIDTLRARKDDLLSEAAEVEEQESEARTLLRQLKGGAK